MIIQDRNAALTNAIDRATKYKAILQGERLMAEAVAVRVIKSKPLTVWEVCVPPILIFNLIRLKSTREIFCQNYLFTKKLAMDAALEIARENQSRESAWSGIRDKTGEVLAADTQGIYSHKIRQAQLREIDLLLTHYCLLLQANGDDYASLIAHSYGTKKNYVQFLVELAERETAVKLVAMETLGTKGSPEIMTAMEVATGRLRGAKTEEIFGGIPGR